MTDSTKHYARIMGAGLAAGLLVHSLSTEAYWRALIVGWAFAAGYGVVKLVGWMDRTFGW